MVRLVGDLEGHLQPAGVPTGFSLLAAPEVPAGFKAFNVPVTAEVDLFMGMVITSPETLPFQFTSRGVRICVAAEVQRFFVNPHVGCGLIESVCWNCQRPPG